MRTDTCPCPCTCTCTCTCTWAAFQAPTFPYDEALRLARAVGVDLDKNIVGSLAEKKGFDLTIWDSVQRANKAALSSADGSSGMINANFGPAMQAILEVLPVGTAFSGVDLPPDVAGAGNDFDALENLRRVRGPGGSAEATPPLADGKGLKQQFSL